MDNYDNYEVGKTDGTIHYSGAIVFIQWITLILLALILWRVW